MELGRLVVDVVNKDGNLGPVFLLVTCTVVVIKRAHFKLVLPGLWCVTLIDVALLEYWM